MYIYLNYVISLSIMNETVTRENKEKEEKSIKEENAIPFITGLKLTLSNLKKTHSAKNIRSNEKLLSDYEKQKNTQSQISLARTISEKENQIIQYKTIQIKRKIQSTENKHMHSTISYEKELIKKKVLKQDKKTSVKAIQTMLDRFKLFEIAKEKKLESIKNEKEKVILDYMTKIPKINEKSKMLIQGSFFTRQEKFKIEKEQKLKINKQIKEIELNKQVSIKKNNKNKKNNVENNIINQLKWEKERKQKIINMQEKEKLEETKYCTFKPELNVNYKASSSGRLYISRKLSSKDDQKTDFYKTKNDKDLNIPRNLNKKESYKNYSNILNGEAENNIIENLFNEKFRNLENSLI